MSTLSEAKLPSLKDKIEAKAEVKKEEVEEAPVKKVKRNKK